MTTTGLYPLPALEHWNIRLFESLRAAPDASHLCVYLGTLMTELPVYLAIALLAVVIVRQRDWQPAIAIAIALACTRLVESIVKLYAYHPRPFAAGFGPALVEHAANNSMPSSHATFIWTIAASMALYRRWKTAGALATFGAIVAWARIYTGLHWPMDMAGSIVVSALCALLGMLAQRSIRRRRAI